MTPYTYLTQPIFPYSPLRILHHACFIARYLVGIVFSFTFWCLKGKHVSEAVHWIDCEAKYSAMGVLARISPPAKTRAQPVSKPTGTSWAQSCAADLWSCNMKFISKRNYLHNSTHELLFWQLICGLPYLPYSGSLIREWNDFGWFFVGLEVGRSLHQNAKWNPGTQVMKCHCFIIWTPVPYIHYNLQFDQLLHNYIKHNNCE